MPEGSPTSPVTVEGELGTEIFGTWERQKNIVLPRCARLRALPFCRWERPGGVLVGLEVERAMGFEPTTFSLGS